MSVRCFFLEATDRAEVSLRRYHDSRVPCAASGVGYHEAHVVIGESPLVLNERGYYDMERRDIPREDPRWPARCACGYAFTVSDEWHVFQSRLYVRQDTGEGMTLRHPIPPGAMWYADWLLPHTVGPDGHCLMVMTPGGEWCVDGEASNCTRRGDPSHRCWIRHGEPPNVTVDKTGGETCAAGAGSIMAGNYHGFLRNGVLT